MEKSGKFKNTKRAAPCFIILMNHAPTVDQEREANALTGCRKMIFPPADLQRLWAAMPPEAACITGFIQPLLDWLRNTAETGDYLLVQGDFGATFFLVNFALKLGLVPVYATSRRETVETVLPDGSVRQERVFRHVRFRKYSG